MKWWILFLSVWLLTSACATAENYALMQAKAGYDGVVFGGRWFPLQVTVRATDGDIDGILSVRVINSDTETHDRIELAVQVKHGETKEVRFPVALKAYQRQFDVKLTDSSGNVMAQCSTYAADIVPENAMVIGVLGGTQELVRSFNVSKGDRVLGREETIVAVQLTDKSFPENECEMNAFDVLAVDQFDIAQLTPDQQILLRHWIEGGGMVLVGAGKGSENALAWLGQMTGISVSKQSAPFSGIVPALMAYAGTASNAGSDAETELRMMSAPQRDVLAKVNGRPLLAATECGKGIVYTCAFSLADPAVTAAAEEAALWRRIWIAHDPLRYSALFRTQYGENYTLNNVLQESQHIGEGNSVLPAVAFLAAYGVIIGFGLYLMMKRADRSKELWILIPTVTIVSVAIMAVFSRKLMINTPVASSVRATIYGTDGSVRTEESATINTASRDRIRVSTENGDAVEERSSLYYNSWQQEPVGTVLGNVIRLGSEPYIELRNQARWLSHSVMIRTDLAPQGSVEAMAYIKKDGLHIEVENQTDVDLKDAVLLTRMGYAELGTISAGQKGETLLRRMQDMPQDSSGNLWLDANEMLPCNAENYEVIKALVYPEHDETFELKNLDEEEQYRRRLRSIKLNMAMQCMDGDALGILVADTPQVPCTRLLADGKPIERMAQTSLLIKQISAEVSEEKGHYYAPQGKLAAYTVIFDADGKIRLGEKINSMYLDSHQEMIAGYAVSELSGEEIGEIRIVPEIRAHVEGYDPQTQEWIDLGEDQLLTLETQLAQRLVGPQGILVLRVFTAENWYMSAPEIIVEGRDEI